MSSSEHACTCTRPPSYEGPCAWCDVHGLPSAAFEQGLAEGEHCGRVVHNLALAQKDAEIERLRVELERVGHVRDRYRTNWKFWHEKAVAAMNEEDRLRRLCADEHSREGQAAERPSIPLDALKAISQGEPLDEVAGDFRVPLDVVKAVAPLVGRTTDPDVCLCRFGSTCHICGSASAPNACTCRPIRGGLDVDEHCPSHGWKS